MYFNLQKENPKTPNNYSNFKIQEKSQSPMPTCASCIMLTSLAPSPTASVIGFSGEIFISLITWKTYNELFLYDKIFDCLALCNVIFLK